MKSLLSALAIVVCAGSFNSNASDLVAVPRATGFTSAASLNNARSQHTATLLSNGKVLVVGGEMDGGTTLQSSEVYDPVANTWTTVATLNVGRKRHTATLLSNGTVHVAGGLSDAGTVSSAEIYDPVANTWTTTSAMSTPRQSFTATVLPNGKILVAGGCKQTTGAANAAVTGLNTSEIFDPSSNGWTPASNMSKARFFHTAILLTNNKVLVASGASAQTQTTATTVTSAELFDYIQNVWTTGGTLTAGRSQAVLAPISNNRVLVAGGLSAAARLSSAELYDSQQLTWSATGSLNVARTLHTATTLSNGQVFVAGGFDGNNAMNSSELYDPVTALWSSAGTLIGARQYHTATLLQNGKVLLVGGNNQINLSTVELFDPGASNAPLTLASAPSASPNPASISQAVSFSASASGGTGALTYAWSFGDGSSGSGASVIHAYSASGTFNASVTITDATNASVSGNVAVTVGGNARAVVVGIGADNDGDGFSNVVEQTMGSNPADPNSIPLGVTNVLAPLPLTVAKLKTLLVFNRGNHDLIHLVGAIQIPSGFVTAGTKIGVDINGIPYLATLDAHGNSGTVFKLLLKKTRGVVQPQLGFFVVNLYGGTYSKALGTVGMTNGDFRNKMVSVKVSVLFNGLLYQTSKSQTYFARLGKYGTSH